MNTETRSKATRGNTEGAAGKSSRRERTEADALRNASFASLTGKAVTPPAQELVAAVSAGVAGQVTVREHDTGAPKVSRAKLKAATEAFLADLITAHSDERSQWVYRALNARGFSGGPVGYRTFMPLQEALKDVGLIEHRPGVARWSSDPFEGGPSIAFNRKAARFRATPKLLDLSRRCGVRPSDAYTHFDYGPPAHPLQKRKASTKDAYGRKASGALMKFTHTEASLRLEADVREINQFLARQKIEGGLHRGYVRVFNNGDDPHFDWNFGGRLYSQPSGDQNYQQLDGTQRRKMTINGEPVAEVDIRASFLTIFHAWHGVQLDPQTDPYEVNDLGKDSRDVVKLWMVATFGARKPLTRWPSKMVRDYNTDHPRAPLDRKRFAVSRIGQSLVAKYPLLAQWGAPIAGRPTTWADLQFSESAVVVSTMLRLKREHAVPSLAVHDSVIVPYSQADLAAENLSAMFKDRLGTQPLIKINRPILLGET